MKVALLLGPGWYSDAPALGPALLAAYLRQHGHEAICIDLGAAIRKASSGRERPLLPPSTQELEDEASLSALLSEHRGLVERTIAGLRERGVDVVGFTAYSSTWRFSLEMARRIKAAHPEIGTVLGGPMAVLFTAAGGEDPNGPHGLDAIDAVVPGEGEIPLLNLLAERKNAAFRPCAGAHVKVGGRFVWLKESSQIEDLDSLPFPEFEDFKPEDYRDAKELVTYFSRGCIRKCVFCDVETYWGNWRNRSGTRVMAELEYQMARHPGVTDFIFCDSILNADVAQLESFCDLMAERRAAGFPAVRWRGYAVVRKEMTESLCRKMKAAGCRELWFGIESGSQRVLNSMRKGYDVATAEAVLESAHRAGIGTMVLLMTGFPTETEEDFERTLTFLRKNERNILEVWPSESFTYLGPGTYLKDHASDRFGIDPASLHSAFWKSKDGLNTYPVRLRRFEALIDCVKECGIRLCSSADVLRGEREYLLAIYERYEIERAGGNTSELAPLVRSNGSPAPSAPGRHGSTAASAWRHSGSWIDWWAAQWETAMDHLKRDEAAQVAEQLERLERDAPPQMRGALYDLLAQTYVRLNRLDRARETVARARKAGVSTAEIERASADLDWTARWRAAVRLLERDEPAAAAARLEALEAETPSLRRGALYDLLAQAYARSNRSDRAREAVARAREAGVATDEIERTLKNMNWTSRWRTALERLEQDAPAEAAGLLEALESDAPSDLRGALYDLLAQAFLRSNQLDRARKTVDRARDAGGMTAELEKLASRLEAGR